MNPNNFKALVTIGGISKRIRILPQETREAQIFSYFIQLKFPNWREDEHYRKVDDCETVVVDLEVGNVKAAVRVHVMHQNCPVEGILSKPSDWYDATSIYIPSSVAAILAISSDIE